MQILVKIRYAKLQPKLSDILRIIRTNGKQKKQYRDWLQWQYELARGTPKERIDHKFF